MTDPLHGVRAFYDQHSATFLQHAGPTFQAGLLRRGGVEDAARSNLALAERAGVLPGHRVLDAGCGVAGPALDIAAALADVVVDGVTLSPVQAALAADRIAAAGLADRVRVQVADYHHLPFAAASFDCVLYLESAGYSTDPAALFAEARRVLRPGGRLYIKDVVRRPGRLSPQQQEELAAYDATWAVPGTPTVDTLQSALAASGFVEQESSELDVGSSHFIGSMFELGPDGFVLNAFGEGFFRRFVDLPILFAELRARAPG